MTDEAIELADRMRDAGPAIEWTPAGELGEGDRVLYLGLTVTVTGVEPRGVEQRGNVQATRIHYRYDQFDGYFTKETTCPLARLVAEKPTAPGSDPRAADRADDTARNGA